MSSVTTQPSFADAHDAIQQRQKRAALAVAMLGFAVVALDAQITNVALPTIREHLGGGLSGLQWVVTGYTLMFSALLLSGGSVADRIGSRNAYRAGMTLFVPASLPCGLAPSLPALIVASLVQGAGAALVTPTSLSLVREASEDAREWARAIALHPVIPYEQPHQFSRQQCRNTSAASGRTISDLMKLCSLHPEGTTTQQRSILPVTGRGTVFLQGSKPGNHECSPAGGHHTRSLPDSRLPETH